LEFRVLGHAEVNAAYGSGPIWVEFPPVPVGRLSGQPGLRVFDVDYSYQGPAAYDAVTIRLSGTLRESATALPQHSGLAASASPTTVVTPPPGRAAVTATPPLSVTRPPGRGLDTATPAVALTRPPGIAIVTTTPAVTVTRPPGRPGATPGATTGPTLSFE